MKINVLKKKCYIKDNPEISVEEIEENIKSNKEELNKTNKN